MMKKFGLIVAALFAAFLVLALSYFYPWGTWRYKVTVTVETPEGIKTGFAVREVSAISGYQSLAGIGGCCSIQMIKGEAVVVDLGKRGVLFAITQGSDDYRLVFEAFPLPHSTAPFSDKIHYYSHLKNAKVVFNPPRYLSFVHFKGINDPKTVEGVSSYDDKEMPDGYGGIAKTTEAIFGQGVKIKEVTIEMTDDPVTRQIDKYLPWLVNIKSNIDGTFVTLTNQLSNNLDVGKFKQGIK